MWKWVQKKRALERSGDTWQVLSHEENAIVQPTENAQNTQPTEKKEKKKRGLTTMHKVPRGLDQRMQVSFNEYGQPWGTNSEKFASFLGVLAR